MRRLSVCMALAGYGGLLVALRPRGAAQAFWTYWSDDPERALVAAAGLVGWFLAAWLFIVTGLAVAAQAPSAAGRIAARIARFVTPRATRRLLGAALGVVMAVGPAGAALAGPGELAPVPAPIVVAAELSFPNLDRPLPEPPTPTATPTLTGRPALPAPATPAISETPSAPATSEQPTSPATPAELPAPAQSHAVLPGDTLWDLASAASPPGASPAAITEQWKQWYALNRATIGADPDLLLPGELLSLPRGTP
jgi:hypothetical protein